MYHNAMLDRGKNQPTYKPLPRSLLFKSGAKVFNSHFVFVKKDHSPFRQINGGQNMLSSRSSAPVGFLVHHFRIISAEQNFFGFKYPSLEDHGARADLDTPIFKVGWGVGVAHYPLSEVVQCLLKIKQFGNKFRIQENVNERCCLNWSWYRGKNIWQRWDSNPRLRGDRCLKPAP